LFSESRPDLGIHIRHDHFPILIGQGHPQLVVELFDLMEVHSGDNGTVGHGVRGLSGGDRIEGSQNADLTALIHGRVTEGKDFKFQNTKDGMCRAPGTASA